MANIAKLSKDGLGPSQIGMRLRDENAIPQIKTVLGKGLKQAIADNKNAPPMPEDLGRLVGRASRLKTHLANHHADRKNVRSLELLEAKIHRLSNYYKRNGEIQENWKYSAAVAQLA